MENPLIRQKTLSLDILEENTGQLPGLPENPRYITEDKMNKLKENITAYPEMLEWRSLLVYPLPTGNYIIIGGNQRYKALRELGHTEAPCIIIDETTTVERLKALTVLDNASFGKFDMDSLANLWDDAQLDSFGVDIPTFKAEPLDDLFTQEPSAGADTTAPDKIIITIPDELEDDKTSILEFVSDFLADNYSGCSISFKKPS